MSDNEIIGVFLPVFHAKEYERLTSNSPNRTFSALAKLTVMKSHEVFNSYMLNSKSRQHKEYDTFVTHDFAREYANMVKHLGNRNRCALNVMCANIFYDQQGGLNEKLKKIEQDFEVFKV